MKINWGTAIVLSFIAFICFILYFVVRMSTDNRANHDLVTEDYYKQTVEYQNEIDAENNANKNAKLKLTKAPDGLLILFPNEIDPTKITGKISFYRPSNKQLDFEIDLKLSNTSLLVSNKRMIEGRWDVKVFWEYSDEEYLHKESITY